MNRDPEQAERTGAMRRQRERAENIDSLIDETLKLSERRELASEQRTNVLLAIIAQELRSERVEIASDIDRVFGEHRVEINFEPAPNTPDFAALKLAADRYEWLRKNINRLVFGHDAMRRGEFIVEIVPPRPNIAILDNDEAAALDRAIDRAIAAQPVEIAYPTIKPPPGKVCDLIGCDDVGPPGLRPQCNNQDCPNRLPQPPATHLEPPQLMYCGECGESKLGSPPSCAKPGCPEGPL